MVIRTLKRCWNTFIDATLTAVAYVYGIFIGVKIVIKTFIKAIRNDWSPEEFYEECERLYKEPDGKKVAAILTNISMRLMW